MAMAMAAGEEGILRLHGTHGHVRVATISHLAVQHLIHILLLLVSLVEIVVVEFIVKVVGVFLFIVPFHSRTPFVAIVPSPALRTGLRPVLAFILVTRAADWKPTLVTSGKELAFQSHAHIIPADLADVAVHIAQRLHRPICRYDNELIPLVGSSDQARISLHCLKAPNFTRAWLRIKLDYHKTQHGSGNCSFKIAMHSWKLTTARP
jgi:hypothetical protein